MELIIISAIVLFVVIQTKMVNTDELFDSNDFSKKDVEVFIATIEKIFGAKSGSMNFISNLIGGKNE